MLNILVSLVAGVAAGFLTLMLPGANLVFSIIAGMVVSLGGAFFLMRHVQKKIMAISEKAQTDAQANRMEKAIAELKKGYKYSNWQLFTRAQIDSQIGMLYFVSRDFKQAFPYLQKSFVRNWTAMGMLGVCYMKRHNTEKMIETFEKGTSVNKKEPLMWNLYAFCLEKVGNRDKAVDVMAKAIQKCGNDDRLMANYEALQNGRKMKMQLYGEMWSQFHLEKMGAMIKKQTKAMTGRRKMQVR